MENRGIDGIRIESDGTSMGTRIYDSAGRRLNNVRAITIRIDGDSPLVTATLDVIFTPASVNVPAGSVSLSLPWIATVAPRLREAVRRFNMWALRLTGLL